MVLASSASHLLRPNTSGVALRRRRRHPYNAAASSGSNLAPTSADLIAAVEGRIAALRAADPANDAPIPVDLVTASASGLDPHISVAAALYQLPRVARARGVDAAQIRPLIDAGTEDRQFGILGERRVNVLKLNLMVEESVIGDY